MAKKNAKKSFQALDKATKGNGGLKDMKVTHVQAFGGLKDDEILIICSKSMLPVVEAAVDAEGGNVLEG